MKSNKTQKKMAIALAYLIHFPAIVYAVTNLVAAWRIPIISSLASPLLYTSFYVMVATALVYALQRMSFGRFSVLVLVVFAFLIASVSDQGNSRYMWTRFGDLLYNPAYTFWLFSFSAFLMSDHVQDMELLSEIMEKFSYAAIFLAALQYFVALRHQAVPQYMTFSYNILFSVAYLLVLYINQAGRMRLIAGLLGGVLIFFAGCRGALIGLIVSVVLALMFGSSRMSARRAGFTAAIAILGVVILMFGQEIASGLVTLLDRLNIESRTVEKIVSESFLDDSGRSGLIEKCLEDLNAFGWGLYGDRARLGGSYPHNISIEILVDFGLFFGPSLLAVLLVVIVGGFRNAQGHRKAMICALISTGAIKLLFTGSFLNREPSFYLLIGLCLDSLRAKREAVGRM